MHYIGMDCHISALDFAVVNETGRLVCHARRIIFQLAEVAVPKDLFIAILEWISRLCLAPG